MAFCIECGAKAPDVAKFCPQCGVELVAVETPVEAEATPEPVVASAEVAAAEIEAPETTEVVETVEDVNLVTLDAAPDVMGAEAEPADIDPVAMDAAPSPESSLAAAASVAEDAPKSKAGLFIGLAVAVLAAGGGAYAAGLFGGGEKDAETVVSAPDVTSAAALPETENIDTETPGSDPVLTAYQDAIKTGRISNLGQFAKENPESGLAKDAERAAFASLQRQNSVLAFSTFTEYFPDADLTDYLGPRANSDEGALSAVPVDVEFNTAPMTTTSIRTSINARAGELEPFIAQGNIDYAVSVIDEMLGQSDLNEEEATYLLNMRARAETSRGLAVPAQVEITQPDPVQTEGFREVKTCWDGSLIDVSAACPATPELETLELETPEPETSEPETPAAVTETPQAVSTPDPPSDRPFDTAAKPIERFGAITPDAATEPGECDMAFSINTSGSPTNIIASCTDPLFIEAAKETVAEWTYSPALLNGAPVRQDGVVVKIKFHLE